MHFSSFSPALDLPILVILHGVPVVQAAIAIVLDAVVSIPRAVFVILGADPIILSSFMSF